MKVDIHADRRRIFLALVEPEYRELWMRFPGQEHGGRLAASQAGDLFRLDYYRAGEPDLSIVGAYHTRRWRKIICSWWMGTPKSSVSSVEFHMDGSFGDSVLRLNHRGIVSECEYLWHQEMWRLSLAKLQCVFQDPITGPMLDTRAVSEAEVQLRVDAAIRRRIERCAAKL